MDNKSTWLRDALLGAGPTKKQQTVADLIGGSLLLGGVIGAWKGMNVPTYAKITQGVQSDIGKVLPAVDIRGQAAQAGLEKSLAGYQQRAVGETEAGLGARGITDKGVVSAAKAETARGLSGAYATARAALQRAKLNAATQTQGAMSRYYQNLAEIQYNSLLNNYYGKMGLWGALGGLGAGVMQLERPKDKEAKNKPGPTKGQVIERAREKFLSSPKTDALNSFLQGPGYRKVNFGGVV